MYIFYDFETSSRDLLGQILSYAFIVTDTHYEIIEELTGLIQLNRTQVPSFEALLVNGLDVDTLQSDGEPEPIAVQKIHEFLTKQCNTYGTPKLIGFNSNQFDLQFLRNAMIRYGINPYYGGTLRPLDCLHYMQYIAYHFPDDFPWLMHYEKQYAMFKLETLAQSFNLLTDSQSHDAREDVALTIQLVKKVSSQFGLDLADFHSITLPEHSPLIKAIDRPIADVPFDQSFKYRYYHPLWHGKSDIIMIDLEAYDSLSDREKDIWTCFRYINKNKGFIFSMECDPHEQTYWSATLDHISQSDQIQSLNRSDYFKAIKKERDIEYQIHELGFDNIPKLYTLIQTIKKDPNQYAPLLNDLLHNQKKETDTHLIRLFNRYYLNHHPAPDPKHLKRYIVPRYITGTLYQHDDDKMDLNQILAQIDKQIFDGTLNERNIKIATSLKHYIETFIRIHSIESIVKK